MFFGKIYNTKSEEKVIVHFPNLEKNFIYSSLFHRWAQFHSSKYTENKDLNMHSSSSAYNIISILMWSPLLTSFNQNTNFEFFQNKIS